MSKYRDFLTVNVRERDRKKQERVGEKGRERERGRQRKTEIKQKIITTSWIL